jgi:hypothetical protein
MKDQTLFLQIALLHLQTIKLINSILPLQKQVIHCKRELRMLQNSPDDISRIRDLEDEIFGCKIAISTMQFRIRKLADQAQRLQAAGVL